MAVARHPELLDDREWLERTYAAAGRSAEAVGAALCCSGATVVRALDRHGIGRRRAAAHRVVLDDREWLERAYVGENRSAESIGVEVGCSETAVVRALDRHRISRRGGPGPRPLRLDDAVWLENAYLVERRSTYSIGAQLGCARSTVGAALARLGVGPLGGRPDVLDDRRWLTRVYITHGRSAGSIALEVGCSPSAVVAALHRHAIAVRPASVPASDRLDDREYLNRRYWDDRWSTTRIGTELGCHANTVRVALAGHDIPVRPGRPRIDQLHDRRWLTDQRGRHTPAEIAAGLGCAQGTVKKALRRFGLPAGPGKPGRPVELDDDSFLNAQYVQGRRTAAAIAADLGCSDGAVLNALRRHHIPIRHQGTGGRSPRVERGPVPRVPVNPAAMGEEAGWLPSTVDDVARVMALLDGRYAWRETCGVADWLVRRAKGWPDPTSSATRSRYRELLRELSGDLEPVRV